MENNYKPKEFAAMLNVSVKTLPRWDTEESSREESRGRNVIYSRVSSQGTKDDLVNQTEFLRQFANARGIIVDEVIEEVGSGISQRQVYQIWV